MKRSAIAVWNGRLKAGQGTISTQSRVLLDSPYSFSSRFGDQTGTNPEELLAAAVASCFSMALSNELELAGLAATLIETQALVRIDFAEEKWSIREVDLFLKANIHGAPSLPFLVAASRAKAHCPLSRALAAQVTLHTELRDQHPGSETEEEVVVYTSTYCQVCGRAKALLEGKGIRYREVDLDQESPEVAEILKRKTGLMSVPQIFVGEHYVGTYDDLVRLDADHGLKPLLQPKAEETKSNPVRRIA